MMRFLPEAPGLSGRADAANNHASTSGSTAFVHRRPHVVLRAPRPRDGAAKVQHTVCFVQPGGSWGGPQQPANPQQQPQQQQQQVALTRRQAFAPVQSQRAKYLSIAQQIMDKQVITCDSGRSLGVTGEAWVDPFRMEVVSIDLEAKKAVGNTWIGSMALQMLRQVGDVVLVEENALSGPILDGRFNYVKLLGLEVRTPMGRVLGKVGDATTLCVASRTPRK